MNSFPHFSTPLLENPSGFFTYLELAKIMPSFLEQMSVENRFILNAHMLPKLQPDPVSVVLSGLDLLLELLEHFNFGNALVPCNV